MRARLMPEGHPGDMRTSRTTTLAMTLALGLTLTACGGDEDPGATPTADATPSAVPAPAPEDDEGTDDDSTGSEDASGTDDATGTDDGTASASGDAGSFDPTASGLAAVETAEAEAGGTAYALDDEDGDGGWEVDVAVDGRSVEVTVGPDGTVVETEDDDLDEEDRAALEAAVVTLAEAVGTAVAEVGGGLDDVELDDEDGTWVWDVSLDDTDNGNEVDVKVGTTTGEVVSSEG